MSRGRSFSSLRVYSVALIAMGLVAAAGAGAARADGLPVLGVDVGNSGVVTTDGARYVTMASGGRTVVARVAQTGGTVLMWRSFPGTFTIPAVAYDGSAGGLSADGKTLALIEPRQSFPRAQTRFLILGRGLAPRGSVTLTGDFSFDAISPNGDWLYLIHYTSPQDPTRYLVQGYDLRHWRLSPAPIVDPTAPHEKMRGNPLTRAMSADGRWAYTLYDGGGGTPFVHALDTVARSAHCIDLDTLSANSDLSKLRLAVVGGGKQLEIRGGSGGTINVDLRTFRVSSGGGLLDALQGARFLLVAGFALLAAAILVLVERRRRRQTVRPVLEPLSEI
jgi:hypothetical protein